MSTEYKAVRQKFRINIDQKTYEVLKPSVDQQDALNLKLETCDKGKVHEVYAEFFAELGIPKEVSKSLDQDDFLGLIKFILTSKKNSQTE